MFNPKKNKIPEPKKHIIYGYLFFASVLFNNNNAMAIFIDAKDQLDAENKLKIHLNEMGSADNVESTFVCPVVEVVR